jgi:hypothetical protein
MDFAQQIPAGTGWQLPLVALGQRLKIAHVDFTRKEDKRLVSAIQSLWIEPLISEKDKQGKVYLQVREDEVFTLRSMTLQEDGLECELVGYTTMVKVGEDAPRHNVVPSWLSYLVEQQVGKALMKLLGLS